MMVDDYIMDLLIYNGQQDDYRKILIILLPPGHWVAAVEPGEQAFGRVVPLKPYQAIVG